MRVKYTRICYLFVKVGYLIIWRAVDVSKGIPSHGWVYPNSNSIYLEV